MNNQRRQQLAKKAKRLYHRACTKDDKACVIGFIDHHRHVGELEALEDLQQFLSQQLEQLDENAEDFQTTSILLDYLNREGS